MKKKLMASVLAIALFTSNFAYAAETSKELEKDSTREAAQETPKEKVEDLAEVPATEDLKPQREEFSAIIDKLLGQKDLYKTLKTADSVDTLSVYIETLQGDDLYSFVVFMQHEFLFMVTRDIKVLKNKVREPKEYKEILDYALGQLMKWGTLLDTHVQNQPLDKMERGAIEQVLFGKLKEVAKEVATTEKMDSLKSLRKSLEKSTGVPVEELYEKLSCFRAEACESQFLLEQQRKAFQAIYKAYGLKTLDQEESKEEVAQVEESLPEKKKDIPLEKEETKGEKESNKKPDLLKKYTEDTISGDGKIKTLSVKSHIKGSVKDESNSLIEAASGDQDYTTFSVEAKIEGASKVLLETWFSGAGKKDKRSYNMKEEWGLYGVEIPYQDSGVYDTKDGIMHYQLKVQDESGRTIETSKADSVKAYGGYLDGSYIGTKSAKTFKQKGKGLDVWGSFAVSTTMVITGMVRIHGDSTVWLETQDGNPSLYLNGNTSIVGDGSQSKVIMSRKLRLKDDAGSIAVQAGAATISNLSFSSEDNNIGGTSGKSHGIWGNTGTSLTVRNCRLSSRATWTIVGTYGNAYTQNTTFDGGITGIHFNGSFGSGLEIRIKDSVFRDLNEGIQGGTLNGKRVMSLYLDGQNRFTDTNQAITVANGAYLSFASNSSTTMERVGGGVSVTNFDRAALRNAFVSGRSTEQGLLIVNTPGEIAKINVTGFNVGVQLQGNSRVKSAESQIHGNRKGVGVLNYSVYEHTGGSIKGNTEWGVHHAGESFWFTGGSIAGNSTGDVYLERGKVIDWVQGANTERTRVLSAEKTLGTHLVRNQRQSGTAAVLGREAEDSFVAIHGGRYMGRGGDRNEIETRTLVLSTSYDVKYHKNSSDQIGDMPSNNIKYWNEKYDIPGNEPKNLTYSFIDFEGWDTVADGNVDKLPGGQLTANRTTDLRAVWRDNIRVYYNSNYGDDTEKLEKVSFDSIKTDGYKVQENSGFTDYSRERYTYGGFDFDKNQSAKNAAYKEGREDRISIEEMLRHAQEKNGVLTLNIYAIWDKLPEIQFQGKDEFYEGTDVPRGDLMANVTAHDQEDGDLAGKLKIVEIRYGEGKLNTQGKPTKGETVSYPNGMGENDKLDTWFMVLDKKKSPVSHEVVYEITDSAGGTTRAPQKVKVKYNEFPEIVADDRYFTLEDAQNGKITEQELLGDALAEGRVTVNDKEEDPKYMKDRLGLSWFDPSEFTVATDDMMVLQEYVVKDSMGPGGTGKETKKRFKIFVRKVGKVEKEPPTSRIRGIDEKNYRKNEGKYLLNLSPEEMEVHNKNGGLNVDSIWYRSAKHREMMETGFRNEVEAIYRFDHEDVLAVQDFIEENGIGNSKDPTALQRFADKFLIDVKENVKK